MRSSVYLKITDLEGVVRRRLSEVGVSPDNVDAAFALLAPLGLKGDAGDFHRDHSLRVAIVCDEIAKHFGLDEKALLLAGLLHDVGKALVPSCTLGATDHWTDADRAAMEEHATSGFMLLRDRFDFTAHVVVQHHSFQARKYPAFLPDLLHAFSLETIAKMKLCARILAVADVFDALHRVNTASGGSQLTDREISMKLYLVEDGGDAIVRQARDYVCRTFPSP